MYWLRRLKLLLPGERRRRERELNEELNANLALAIEDARQSGASVNDAERVGRRHFGSLTRAREEARAFWLPGWDTISQDVRFATRTLVRNPLFTLVAIFSLALGTGAATALFSVVDTVVLKPLAYRDPSRLVMMREIIPPMAHIYPTLPVNYQHFRYWRKQSRSFESIAAITSNTLTLRTADAAETIGGAKITAGLFEMLGVQPRLGRAFRPDEEQPGKTSVIVITDGLWRRRFGASPSVLGQQVRLGDLTYSVVGVLPPDFRFPRKDDLGTLTRLHERTEIFLPLQARNSGWEGDHDFIVFGRLKPGIQLADAAAELNVLESRIVAEHKLTYALQAHVKPLQEVIGAPVRSSLAVLFTAVLTLVAIVCVNLANLLLARGSARAREFSMRLALGASRGRLILSALTETLVLSAVGGILGVLAAYTAVRAFVSTAPVDLPRIDEIAIDSRVLAFALTLSLVCGLLFGLVPALRLSQSNLQGALRSESASLAGNRGALRLREGLVSIEVALGTCLLFLAALLVGSLWNVLSVDRGFRAEQAMDVRMTLPARYGDPKSRLALLELFTQRLRALPGVQAVAAASKAPLTGESNVNNVRLKPGDEGLSLDAANTVMVNIRFIDEHYFSALGVPVRQGRPLEPADRDRNVVVISERLAKKLWPAESPLGKSVSGGSQVQDAQVVGVVADVHTTRLDHDPTLMMYYPYWKQADQVSGVIVRSMGQPASVMDSVRSTLRSIDPGIPAPKMRPMEELVSEAVSQRRLQMSIATTFAASALLLAALGIYGVVAYGATLRRREIGIRVALGARAAQVRRLIVWQGLRPVAIGAVAGVAVSLAAGRLIRGLLFGVEATDGLVLSAVTLLLLGVAAVACAIPARAASAVDPAKVLRCD